MSDTLKCSLWHAEYIHLNHSAVQLEWQKLTGGFCVNVRVGNGEFSAVVSECLFVVSFKSNICSLKIDHQYIHHVYLSWDVICTRIVGVYACTLRCKQYLIIFSFSLIDLFCFSKLICQSL